MSAINKNNSCYVMDVPWVIGISIKSCFTPNFQILAPFKVGVQLYSVRFHLEFTQTFSYPILGISLPYLTQPYFITLGSHRFLSLCFFTPGSPDLSSPISSPPLSLTSVHPNPDWLWAGQILRNSNVMCWNFYMSVKSNTLQPRKLIMFYWFAWY